MTTTTLRFQDSINSTMSSSSSNDQFKATKMWNDVLQAFYLGIELKKHRRQMKLYQDCFTATDAITWLKQYLNNQQQQQQRFNDNKITRLQALNLLRKYLEASIIEPVNNRNDEIIIKDNNDLYRFTKNLENFSFLTTKNNDDTVISNDNSKDGVDGGKENVDSKFELDIREKINIYKQIMWSELNRLWPSSSSIQSIDDHLKLANIDGQIIMNNVCRLNQNGIVQLTDKNDDLPPWIMSAMKCLANWPKATGSANCLPKYPGFETDVFQLIRDYFINMEEPIIPSLYYQLFLTVYRLYRSCLNVDYQFPIDNNDSTKPKSNTKHIDDDLGLPAICVYETAFSSKEPVTKIVPIDELSDIFPNFLHYFRQQKHQKYSFNHSNINHSNETNTFRALSTMPRKNRRNKTTTPTFNTTTDNYHESPPENSEYMFDKTFSTNSAHHRFYSLQRQKSDKIRSSNDNHTKNSTDNYYEILQLILLLLPNVNRRYLQLLIRLFARILSNKELCLLTNDSLTLKEHIVTIFTRCIIRSKNERDFDESFTKEFVTFLIDECWKIFEIPSKFLNEIEKSMINVQNEQKEKESNEYCKKISNEEYELQRDQLSDLALNDLLQNIMNDNTISERDKLKWIKQFKMYHPDVYDVYLTNHNGTVNEQQNECKQKIETKKRNRIRSLSSSSSTTTQANNIHSIDTLKHDINS
ncbi:Domain found in Dishevelled, Egl-10, and Pleckstrin (DEP), partial [Dermatophagoides pteronyssinus]